MKAYNISRTTIFIRKDLAKRIDDNSIIDTFDFEGNDKNIMFLSKEKAILYYNELMKDLSIETRRLSSGLLYYKLTRVTIDELDFDESDIDKEINEESINDISNYIFQNTTDINCIEEFRHTKEDLENYRKL